jgi:hypothetical protein
MLGGGQLTGMTFTKGAHATRHGLEKCHVVGVSGLAPGPCRADLSRVRAIWTVRLLAR